MISTAPEHAPSQLLRGRVTMVEGERAVVDAGPQRFVADRAASCLLAPEVGDLVLCDHARRGPSYLMAVLERGASPARLCFDGDAVLHVKSGHLCLSADRGIELRTPGEATVSATALRATAAESSLVSRTVGLVAGALKSEVGSWKTVADEFDVIAGRLWSRVDRAYRFVKERDQLRAGSIDHRAEQTVSVRGRNTMMIAEELVKLDGGQIHVG